MPWLIDSEFIVTKEMLKELREISSDFGFDSTEIASAEDARLIEHYFFVDIRSALGDNRARVGAFHNPNGRILQAFADNRNGGTVVVDKAFSVFLLRLALFSVNYSFSDDNPFLRKELEFLMASRNSGLYMRGLDLNFGDYLRQHRNLYGHGNALWRAFLAFIICHEIAHHRLGHLEGRAKSSQEFSADKLAWFYFRRLVGQGANTVELRLTPNLLSAPAILFRCEVFMDRLARFPKDDSSHPTFEARLQRTLTNARRHWGSEANSFFEQIDGSLSFLEWQLVSCSKGDQASREVI